MSASMQDAAQLSSAWIKEWSPILAELQTGHYLAVSLALPVERVASANTSWMTLHQGLRNWNEEEDGPQEIDESWPGADHFQGPTFFGEMRSFWLVLPSQDLATLSESQVERAAGRCDSPARPWPGKAHF